MERTSGKERHGCLTAWLIVMAVLYVFGIAGSMFLTQFTAKNPALAAATADLPAWWTPLTTMLTLLKLACVAALFWWKRIGFYGLCVTAVVSAAMAFTRLGHAVPAGRFSVPPFVSVLMPFIFLAIWYGVLQIGKENKAWPQLE